MEYLFMVQVHLEIDPHQHGEVQSTTEDRYLLIKDLLSTHLELDCVSCDQEPKHTPAYLLGAENVGHNIIYFIFHNI